MPTRKRQVPALTAELQSAVNTYLMARVQAETLKPIIRQIEADLLREIPVHYDPKWREMPQRAGAEGLEGRIFDPDRVYLGTDEETAIYFEALDGKKQERFPDANRPKNHCPYLVADHLRVQAENLMLDAAVAVHGFPQLESQKLYGDNHRKAVDLILKLVINHPQFKAPKY